MKNLGYLVLFLSVCLIGSSSCGGDDNEPVACQWTLEVQNESNVLQAAIATWVTQVKSTVTH